MGYFLSWDSTNGTKQFDMIVGFVLKPGIRFPGPLKNGEHVEEEDGGVRKKMRQIHLRTVSSSC